MKNKKSVYLPIKGMSCASCVRSVEKALSKLPGVEDVSVNLSSEKAVLSYDEKSSFLKDMVKAIEEVGYGVHLQSFSFQLDENIVKEKNSFLIKSLEKIPGVIEVRVSSERIVELTYLETLLDLNKLERVLKESGYSPVFPIEKVEDVLIKAKKLEERLLYKRFLLALGLTIPLFVISLPHMGIDIFKFLGISHNIMPLIPYLSFIFATPVQLYAGLPFYERGINGFKTKTPNMDSLIIMGTSAAYIYSVGITFSPFITSLFNFQIPSYMHVLYYEVSATIITLALLGKYLESIAKGRASRAIKYLLSLSPKIASVLRNSEEMKIPVDEVLVNDIVVVHPGERIPVDGIVLDGYSAVDESMVTGESIPVDKKTGDEVISGTINKTGNFKFRAQRVGKETFLSQVIRLVEEAQGSKAPIQALADKITVYFIPVVIIIALITFLVWLIAGPSPSFLYALSATIAVLIIACPCALGLATPTGIMVGTGEAAKRGILIRKGEALQNMEEIDTIVFDKTGTITEGVPRVTDVITLNGISKEEFLTLVGSVEKLSEHPLAKSIVGYVEDLGLSFISPEEFEAVPGKGITAKVHGHNVLIGNEVFFKDQEIEIKDRSELDRLYREGKTVVLVSLNREVKGLIAQADTLKEGARETISILEKKGLKVFLITGDNTATARAIGEKIGIADVLAQILPQDKAKVISKLQKEGRKVAMVGDGINDAPALVQADIGIALGTGTDIAIESGDITLIKGDPKKIITVINISKGTMNTIRQNLFWAFIYNITLIPIAAGVLYPFFKVLMNPIFAAIAMSLSSVSVVGNSLRLQYRKFKE